MTNHSSVRRARLYIVAVLCAAMSACVTWPVGTGEPFVDKTKGYAYTAPIGWYQSPAKLTRDKLRTFTRDGSTLQNIVVGRIAHKNAFSSIDKDATPEMLPQDIAENVIADIKAFLPNDTFTVQTNAPATLAGNEGVRISGEFVSEEGLRIRLTGYYANTEDGIYSAVFRAPTLHFYDQHIEEFETSVRTLRIL
ncbi:MAG: hypothetical protein AAGA84_11115 [Pseudomonadota bacterium]